MTLSFRALLSAAFLVALSPLASAASQGNTGAPPINYRAIQVQSARAAAGQAGEYFVNPYRAYPPSCINAPIPLGLYLNDPGAVTKTVTLIGDPLSNDPTERAYTENVTVSVFRVPCGASTSALLLEIDRPANAPSATYPVFPGVSFSTGFVPRVAADPNTWFSQVYAYDPLSESTVVVFENYTPTSSLLNLNQALTVDVANLSSSSATPFSLSAYNPSAYTANTLPLPITGYQTGNFYDDKHSGEGIQIEVGDVNSASHFISVAWYTFDDQGFPYWLIGSTQFSIGATSVGPFTMYYGANGGFAGDFGSSAPFTSWGTITVSFPDCNTMQFSYASNAALPEPVPVGTGSRTWTRTTQLNGLTCQ